MRLILLIAAFALLALTPAYARNAGGTVSLTKTQVATECGPSLGSGGGVTGCTKQCGDKFCGYFCNNKTGKCQGFTIGMVQAPRQPADLDVPPASLATPLESGGKQQPVKHVTP